MPARRLVVFTSASFPGPIPATPPGARPECAACHVSARWSRGQAAIAAQSRMKARRLNGLVSLKGASRLTSTSAADLVVEVDEVETLIHRLGPRVSHGPKIEKPPDAPRRQIDNPFCLARS